MRIVLIFIMMLSFAAVADAANHWPQLSKPQPAKISVGKSLRAQRERVRATYERQRTKQYTITDRRTGKTVRLRVTK